VVVGVEGGSGRSLRAAVGQGRWWWAKGDGGRWSRTAAAGH